MRKPSLVTIIAFSLTVVVVLAVWALSKKYEFSESQKEAVVQEREEVIQNKRLAESYLRDAKYDLAADYYNQALKLRPNDAHLHNDLASTYHYMGKSAFSSPQTEDVRGLSNDQVLRRISETLKLIDSGVLIITVDDPNQAQKIVDYATSQQCLANIGSEKSKYIATIVKGKTKEAFLKAESEYQKAIQIKSRYAPAHRNLGTLYYEMGKKKEALELWRRALKIEPSDDNLKEYLQKLGINN